MNCERNICYQQEYNGGCDTCPCNRTTKEAIENLKKLKSFHNGSYGSSIRIAIEALEKQVPKKPIEYEDKYYGCPTCGNVTMMKWERYPDIPMSKIYGLPYCLGCGQALLWED